MSTGASRFCRNNLSRLPSQNLDPGSIRRSLRQNKFILECRLQIKRELIRLVISRLYRNTGWPQSVKISRTQVYFWRYDSTWDLFLWVTNGLLSIGSLSYFWLDVNQILKLGKLVVAISQSRRIILKQLWSRCCARNWSCRCKLLSSMARGISTRVSPCTSPPKRTKASTTCTFTIARIITVIKLLLIIRFVQNQLNFFFDNHLCRIFHIL